VLFPAPGIPINTILDLSSRTISTLENQGNALGRLAESCMKGTLSHTERS